MTQLRGKDMRNEAGTWVIRITPEAGTVKTKKYRDVPLHLQVIELGFVDFVKRSNSGPLFYRSASENGNKEQAQATSGTISEWLQGEGLIPEELAPSHSWRHRFKTLARDHGSAEFVVNSICSHEGRTEGDNYGDVSIKAKKLVVDMMPRFEFAPEPVEDPP